MSQGNFEKRKGKKMFPFILIALIAPAMFWFVINKKHAHDPDEGRMMNDSILIEQSADDSLPSKDSTPSITPDAPVMDGVVDQDTV